MANLEAKAKRPTSTRANPRLSSPTRRRDPWQPAPAKWQRRRVLAQNPPQRQPCRLLSCGAWLRQHGALLLEALVAVSIAAVALVAIWRAFGQSVTTTWAAQERLHAASLIHRVVALERVGIDPQAHVIGLTRAGSVVVTPQLRLEPLPKEPSAPPLAPQMAFELKQTHWRWLPAAGDDVSSGGGLWRAGRALEAGAYEFVTWQLRPVSR